MEAPGAAFFEVRLARAAAIPPAQRTSDAQAFVESVQLLREADQLLQRPVRPRARGATGTASAAAAARKRALRALLRVVRATFVCPETPVSDVSDSAVMDAFAGLFPEVSIGGGGGGRRSGTTAGGAWRPLADVLWALAVVPFTLNDDSAAQCREAALECQAAAHILADPAQRAAHSMLVNVVARQERQAARAGSQAGSALTPAQWLWAQATQQEAGNALVQLAPDSPFSWHQAGMAEARPERRMEMNRRALQLAQQQRSDFHIILCGLDCFNDVFPQSDLLHNVAPPRATLEAAAALFAEAVAAHRRCARLLPEAWVQALGFVIKAAQPYHQLVQAALQQQAAGSSAAAAPAPLRTFRAVLECMATASEVANERVATACHGCGITALGLRKCSRCRTAAYCSEECQRAHWRIHKRECVPHQAPPR